MNRDINLIFEAYNKSRLLNEMAMKLKGSVEDVKQAIKAGIESKRTPDAKGKTYDTYLFRGVEGPALDSMLNDVIVPIVNELFPNGVYEKPEIEGKDIEKLKNDLEIKLKQAFPSKGTQARFTSRILRDFIGTVIETIDNTVTPGETIQDAGSEIADAIVDADVEAAEQSPEDTNSDEEITVYHKSADFSNDDDRLVSAWKKLPANKDLDWSQVCKLIGASVGMELIEAGGLNEEVKRKEVGEGDYKEGDTGEVTSGIRDEDLDNEDDTMRHHVSRGADEFEFKGSPYRYSDY